MLNLGWTDLNMDVVPIYQLFFLGGLLNKFGVFGKNQITIH